MTDTKPIISVIIKTYDDRTVRADDATLPPLRDVLIDTLIALCKQTISPSEVLIVDSSSGDGIKTVLHDFQLSSDTKLPYSLKHVPLAPTDFTYTHALNVGIDKAKGDILISLSGDATPANEHWLEELVIPLQDNKIAGVYSRHIARPGMHLSLAERFRLWWRYRSPKTEIRESDHVFSNASSCYRASTIQAHPFDESFTELEDYAWAKDVQQAGYRICYAGQSQVYHSHATKTLPTLKRMLVYAWLRLKTDLGVSSND